MFPITRKDLSYFVSGGEKAYHLLFPRVKGYSYLISVHVETIVELYRK